MVRFYAALETTLLRGARRLFRSQKFWARAVPPQININAINVGFVTSLILVLFIIGIVIALAKVELRHRPPTRSGCRRARSI